MVQIITPYSNRNVVVIGGGPSGMSCALWLKNYGLVPIIVETRASLGGLQGQSRVSNTWLLGWRSVTGHDVAETFARHICYERIQHFVSSRITGLRRVDKLWSVKIETSDAHSASFEAMAIVIATGTESVGSDWASSIAGGDTCHSRIFIGPASYGDPSFWLGSKPIIVGGGDNAIECAIFLAGRGSNPLVVARGGLRAGTAYRERMASLVTAGAARLCLNTSITALRNDKDALHATLSTGEKVEGDALLLILGFQPTLSALLPMMSVADRPKLDDHGYVTIDQDCRTNIPGLWAVGDVANQRHPCTATAMAMGTMAARTIAWDAQTN